MHATEIDAVTGFAPGHGSSKGRRGAALLFAISMLAIFSAMGMFYVRYMELEISESDFELRQKRARQLANAGVEIAAADLQQFLQNSGARPVDMASPYAISLPVYRSIAMAESAIETEEMPAPRIAEVTFTIYDESGKININHASASVLQKVMGLSGEVARTIAASVPRGGENAGTSWFLDLDELLVRGLVPAADFNAQAAAQLLTAYSVVDHANAKGFV
ncbi:MAG: hypothetical protein L3K26_13715, partial [Candidatus Hydrogenedentes bacterium]|nr:hypothetical protein [Candidatus Hydrogenedentota bacterium]